MFAQVQLKSWVHHCFFHTIQAREMASFVFFILVSFTIPRSSFQFPEEGKQAHINPLVLRRGGQAFKESRAVKFRHLVAPLIFSLIFSLSFSCLRIGNRNGLVRSLTFRILPFWLLV